MQSPRKQLNSQSLNQQSDLLPIALKGGDGPVDSLNFGHSEVKTGLLNDAMIYLEYCLTLDLFSITLTSCLFFLAITHDHSSADFFQNQLIEYHLSDISVLDVNITIVNPYQLLPFYNL